MKKFLSHFLTLLAAGGCLLTACDSNDTDDTPPVPTVALAAGKPAPTTLTFTATLADAEKAYYRCTLQGSPVPEAAELIESGLPIAASGSVTVEGLEPHTVYRISAVPVSRGGKLTGTVQSIEMTTATPTPVVALTAGTPSHDGLTFEVALTDAQRAAYLCLEKSDGMTLPDAGRILSEGTPIAEAGTVAITGLTFGTTYVIAVAAANYEEFSEVETLEMTTATPATPIVSLVAGTPAQTELSFYVAASDAERTAYVCLEKSASTTVPAAAEIIRTGTAVTDTKVTVSGLNPGTTYLIAVAASNKGVYSEVKTLEMATDEEVAGPIVLTVQADGGYYGDAHNSGYGEYYFVAADGATVERDGVYSTVGKGYAMSFDLYQFKTSASTIKIPARTYNYNTNYSFNTFAPEKTFCMVNDGSGNLTRIEFSAGKIDVKAVGTTYTVTADLTTTTGEAFSATYNGTLRIENRENADKDLPLIEKDLTGMRFIRALAKYYHYVDASDNCIVNLYDVEPRVVDGSDYLFSPGHMVSLDLSTAVSEDMVLQEGVYSVSDSALPGTYNPGYQTKFQDLIMAVGTYCEEMNDNLVSFYGFITGGTVTVTRAGAGYRFELDFTTDKGYKISGSYEGEVTMTDMRSRIPATPPTDALRTVKLRRR